MFSWRYRFEGFLKHYIKEKKGIVINIDGEKIGYHEGVFFYTIGERRSFVITKKLPMISHIMW